MPRIRRTARGGRSKRCSSRGWAKKAPRTRRQRKRVRDKCGDYCFLGKNMSFPVCSKNTRKCRRDRAGVCAAKYRADQHDYKEIARKARRILAGGGNSAIPAMIRPDPSLGLANSSGKGTLPQPRVLG